MNWWQNVGNVLGSQALWSAVVGIATAVLAIITGNYVRITRDASQAAQDAAEYAATAAEAAERQAAAMERSETYALLPIVQLRKLSFRGTRNGQSAQAQLQRFQNVGSGVALNVSVALVLPGRPVRFRSIADPMLPGEELLNMRIEYPDPEATALDSSYELEVRYRDARNREYASRTDNRGRVKVYPLTRTESGTAQFGEPLISERPD